MSRAVSLRLTAGLVLLPITAWLSAQCGGNDVIDAADATAEAAADSMLEGATVDAVSDSRPGDGLFDTVSGDSALRDASLDADASLNDADGRGSAEAADAGAAAAPENGAGEAAAGDAATLDADSANVDAGDAAIGDGAGNADASDAPGDAEGGADSGSPVAPSLGTARTFAVLAGMTITNTGTTTAIVGDVGMSPGTALVGLPPGQVSGTIHLGDAVAMQAEADLTTAYNNLVGRPCQTTMTSIDLGGKTLGPGVYCFASSAAQMVGDLTLDGQGNPNAVWIFQIASTLTVATNVSTTMINSGNACNVYWQVGSSATINGGAQFKGNILAQASISLLTGANVSPGRTLAQTAAVTMQSSAISNAGCP